MLQNGRKRLGAHPAEKACNSMPSHQQEAKMHWDGRKRLGAHPAQQAYNSMPGHR